MFSIQLVPTQRTLDNRLTALDTWKNALEVVDQLEHRERKLKRRNARIAELESQVQDLQYEVDGCYDYITEMETQVDELAEQVIELEDDNQVLEDEMRSLEAINEAKIVKIVTEAQAELKTANEKIHVLESCLQTYDNNDSEYNESDCDCDCDLECECECGLKNYFDDEGTIENQNEHENESECESESECEYSFNFESESDDLNDIDVCISEGIAYQPLFEHTDVDLNDSFFDEPTYDSRGLFDSFCEETEENDIESSDDDDAKIVFFTNSDDEL